MTSNMIKKKKKEKKKKAKKEKKINNNNLVVSELLNTGSVLQKYTKTLWMKKPLWGKIRSSNKCIK